MMTSKIEKILIDEKTIQRRVAELAADITRDYAGKEFTILALMKGSVVFLADLLRLIPIPLKLEVLPVSSYHGITSSGVVNFEKVSLPEIEGRHVLLIDDILDSGRTLKTLTEHLLEKKPAAIRCCVLLHKKSKTIEDIVPHYVGFEIPDAFVVGYGLDYEEYFRNFPDVRVLKPN